MLLGSSFTILCTGPWYHGFKSAFKMTDFQIVSFKIGFEKWNKDSKSLTIMIL